MKPSNIITITQHYAKYQKRFTPCEWVVKVEELDLVSLKWERRDWGTLISFASFDKAFYRFLKL